MIKLFNISHNVRFVQISGSTICDDNPDRNTESAILGTTTVLLEWTNKINQSHYRPEVPRRFQEVKVPRLCDNGPGWWQGCQP